MAELIILTVLCGAGLAFFAGMYWVYVQLRRWGLRQEVQKYLDMLDADYDELPGGKRKRKGQRAVVTSADDATRQIMAVVNSIPKIRNPEDLFRGMSKDMREKMAGPVGHEVLRLIIQVVAQEGEAIRKQREQGLRAALAMSQAEKSADLTIFLHHKQLKTLEVLQKISEGYEGRLHGPWAQEAARIAAREVKRIETEYAKLTGGGNPPEHASEFLPPPQIDEDTVLDYEDLMRQNRRR